MFTLARLKLTVYYLLILMMVSGIFSAVIYRSVAGELEHGYRRTEQRLKSNNPLGLPNPYEVEVRKLLREDLEISLRRVQYWLFIINAFILSVAAIASYFLASKTLHPIETALEEQKRFVSDASHELHTPLTALKTSIEVALREKNLTQKEARQVLTDSLEEVNQLARLNEYLLNLARFERNGDTTPFKRIDLADILADVSKRLKPLALKKKIDLIIKVGNHVIAGDEMSLAKLFTILIDNAIKYTPEKGSIVLSTEVRKKTVAIKVVDTGIGIPKKDLPHIFDRFYRADTSRGKSTQGFGLGLAIAKRIVKLHQGTIAVSSHVHKGTTFIVTLPKE